MLSPASLVTPRFDSYEALPKQNEQLLSVANVTNVTKGTIYQVQAPVHFGGAPKL